MNDKSMSPGEEEEGSRPRWGARMAHSSVWARELVGGGPDSGCWRPPHCSLSLSFLTYKREG